MRFAASAGPVRRPEPSGSYLYCHGGRALVANTDLEIPTLQIGRDDQITPTDFAAWTRPTRWTSAGWADTGSLVFINGCQTAKRRQRHPELRRGLRQHASAGRVIGTENHRGPSSR